MAADWHLEFPASDLLLLSALFLGALRTRGKGSPEPGREDGNEKSNVTRLSPSVRQRSRSHASSCLSTFQVWLLARSAHSPYLQCLVIATAGHGPRLHSNN